VFDLHSISNVIHAMRIFFWIPLIHIALAIYISKQGSISAEQGNEENKKKPFAYKCIHEEIMNIEIKGKSE